MIAELKLRYERTAGKMLADTIDRGGDRKSKSTSHGVRLSDIGITYMQSSRWQSIASIPEHVFEAYVAWK